MGKVAIHGFGRIGRSITKVALKNNLFTPVSISDIHSETAISSRSSWRFQAKSSTGRECRRVC